MAATGLRPTETIDEGNMAHKKQHGGPVPPGNQSQMGHRPSQPIEAGGQYQ